MHRIRHLCRIFILLVCALFFASEGWTDPWAILPEYDDSWLFTFDLTPDAEQSYGPFLSGQLGPSSLSGGVYPPTDLNKRLSIAIASPQDAFIEVSPTGPEVTIPFSSAESFF